MKANRNKLELAMAKACMSTAELQKAAEMPRPTLNNVISGKSAKPATIGRIARALGVDVTEILEGVAASSFYMFRKQILSWDMTDVVSFTLYADGSVLLRICILVPQ